MSDVPKFMSPSSFRAALLTLPPEQVFKMLMSTINSLQVLTEVVLERAAETMIHLLSDEGGKQAYLEGLNRMRELGARRGAALAAVESQPVEEITPERLAEQLREAFKQASIPEDPAKPDPNSN